jgi:hypothetical protein
MKEQQRPSVHDWPAMAADLIERGLRSPNYIHQTQGHQPATGLFARDGMLSLTVTCSIDVFHQRLKILHIAISSMGKYDKLPRKEHLDEVLWLFDAHPPYEYRSGTGLQHYCWPYLRIPTISAT